MSALKASQVDGFLRSPDAACPAVLVYGPDRGSVSERARMLVKHYAGSLDDPFAIARLEEDAIADDPGLLEDEARAIPMMGGRRTVWVGGGGAATAAAMERYLEEPSLDAVIVVEAANLQKSAKLRQVFEKSKTAAALPCYADTSRNLDDIIEAQLHARNLTISPAARTRLIEILGADRRLSLSEIEKLCLYCHGRERVELEDVDAICGDAAALEVDDLIDAAFEGDLPRLDRTFHRLMRAGTAPQMLISMLFGHIARLQKLQLEVEDGANADTALSRARPPVHFSRKTSLKRQLSLWTLDALDRSARATAAAERETRRSDDLGATFLNRHFLSLAHAARARHARR